MVNIDGKGKFYCKAGEYEVMFPEPCEFKTITGLCGCRDKSCMFIDYRLILKVN